jgi:hypothetical protein
VGIVASLVMTECIIMIYIPSYDQIQIVAIKVAEGKVIVLLKEDGQKHNTKHNWNQDQGYGSCVNQSMVNWIAQFG